LGSDEKRVLLTLFLLKLAVSLNCSPPHECKQQHDVDLIPAYILSNNPLFGEASKISNVFEWDGSGSSPVDTLNGRFSPGRISAAMDRNGSIPVNGL
jgi:hypothetical protein